MRLGGPAAALISTALSLAAAELAVRAFGPELHEERRDQRLGPSESPERLPGGAPPQWVLRTLYDCDPRGYFGPGRYVDHAIASTGWREGPHPERKPPGALRVLGLGDSYLFGQGVRAEHVVLRRLGHLLQSHAPPGVRVETINTAVSGSDTVYERRTLERHGLAYQPDLVILHYVLNDVEPAPGAHERGAAGNERAHRLAAAAERPDALARVSRLWWLLRTRAYGALASRAYVAAMRDAYAPGSRDLARVREALDGIRADCAAAGAPLLVVIWPFFVELDDRYPFRAAHEAIGGYLRARGVPVLDLLGVYRGRRGPDLWVHPMDQHPNEEAHELAAQALLRELLRRREELRLPLRP